ncbi:MAG: hypothetical protein B0A82_15210 [Alkalinema sp. CACIAM 70d]|nr:MAG: hypothetical protein B0A82_15210 [Alkalinema sp. CACIAM 70d]
MKSLFSFIQRQEVTITNLSDLQANPIKPLCDTWRWHQELGGWIISLVFDEGDAAVMNCFQGWEKSRMIQAVQSFHQQFPEAQNLINQWFVSQLKKTLNSFDQWMRVWKVEIVGQNLSSGKRAVKLCLEWNPKQQYQDFMAKVLQQVQTYSGAVSVITIYTDMLVYTRTEDSPHQVVHGWIRGYAKFRISPLEKYRVLHIYCTLFCRNSPELEDNQELFHLNQPILSESLKAWEQEFGEINADDGLYGMYRHGFLPWPENLCEN